MIPSTNSRARRAPHRSSPSAQREAGVVLIVVMVLLVAVTFMSISVMRSTLSSDLITNNNRTQTLAMEMAQLALRFCEADVASDKATLFTDTPVIQPKVAANTQMAWQKKDSWEGTGSTLVAKELSEDNLKSANTPFVPGKRPQCLAEYDPNADGVVVMTARGFSPDYKSDSNDKISAGSVVWLQSRFVFRSGGSGGGGTSGGTGTGTGSGTGT